MVQEMISLRCRNRETAIIEDPFQDKVFMKWRKSLNSFFCPGDTESLTPFPEGLTADTELFRHLDFCHVVLVFQHKLAEVLLQREFLIGRINFLPTGADLMVDSQLLRGNGFILTKYHRPFNGIG